jgi:formate dehydrogenase major subunit
MAITRRNFLKGLGGGMASLGLAEAICQSPGWAYTVPAAKIKHATETTSICPYCGVGCGLIAHTSNNKLINLEGDPDHPINQGSLCSKGQAVFQIINNDRRLQKVRYRAPGSDHWEEKDLEWAVQTLAQRVKATRDTGFIGKTPEGVTVNRTEALASIGGAAINNEECYLIAKLMRALGIVYLEHQARL